jgi:hypothetical protein
MIVSVVLAPESRAGKAEVGDTPIVNVPALPVNSAVESFSVPMDQPEPGGPVGVGVGPPEGVGVLVGGLTASAGWLGDAKFRLRTTRTSRAVEINILRLRLRSIVNLLL